ncbi:hypothetical protein Xsto_03970 [Xenorhabdus stockiae]|uniref:Uncharacterized protein n=1 Tax=Xenorhabdus stockiae TaxID=351614 RepID=A0A2D0KAI5_9GAMM|nr:hypothetical protein [Xenorhabdus stockiae]PHM60474.1 hypothetical protein Xsto_03970 [Xenorhabdus stockiae]
MSDVNKLDNKKCSFNPDQYKYKKSIDIEVDDVAPVGSFPWAVIQVYLNKPVRRSDWDFNIYLMPKYDDSGSVIYLQWLDKDGNILPWTPEQEDMVACDWISMDCMLAFSLKLGTSKYGGTAGTGVPGQDWGYMTIHGDKISNESTFGTLTEIQNKTDIESILMFYWEERQGDRNLRLKTSSNKENYENMLNLTKKSLYITVEGVSYNVGVPIVSRSYSTNDDPNYWYTAYYENDDAQKVGTILKQTDQTKTFCLNWK